METVTVGLAERSYQIIIGQGTLGALGTACRELQLGSRVAVVTNPMVGGLYYEVARRSLAEAGFSVQRIEIPDGEEYKSFETLKGIYDALIAGRLDRGSFLVALGGGVVGDIAGFAAATYLRGIPFVQVPTTLLAQVDSSVGGKTGINHPLGKNLIGAFYQPRLVMIDLNTLDTLPEREFLSGLAEVVKYGIVMDKDFFNFLAAQADKIRNRDKQGLARVVKSCCAIKADVVARDERETELRAVLNYGHTIGHAVETLTGYKEFSHGEAVAIGMVQAAKVSAVMGHAASADTERIMALLQALYLPVELPQFSLEAYLDALARDKKVKEGGLSFVFNKGIGDFTIGKVQDIPALLAICGIRG